MGKETASAEGGREEEGKRKRSREFVPHSERGASRLRNYTFRMRVTFVRARHGGARERKRERERESVREREREWEIWKGILFIHYRESYHNYHIGKEEKDMFVVHCSGLLGKKKRKSKQCNTRRGRRRGCPDLDFEALDEDLKLAGQSSPSYLQYKSATLRHCKIIGVLITQFSTK